MTLQELRRLAEVLGATVIPDDVDGPEFVFDSESFERFTDAVFRQGLDFGLQVAARIAAEARAEGAT